MTKHLEPAPTQFLRDEAIRGGMDLLLFAHRSHLRRAEVELADLGLGRAHHRALYFIARQPRLAVGELIDLLAVTKQSLVRVTNDLQKRGLIKQEHGEKDRRQRLLSLTSEGEVLEQRLFADLRSNMMQAYSNSGESAVNGYWCLMQNLMTSDDLEKFRLFRLKSRKR
jgi:DNA-binding MarR family transcriptional regulator